MDDQVRPVAWAIAEAWWRKTNRRAAGSVPEASTSEEYADNFWQGFCDEAKAALHVIGQREAAIAALAARPASNARA